MLHTANIGIGRNQLHASSASPLHTNYNRILWHILLFIVIWGQWSRRQTTRLSVRCIMCILMRWVVLAFGISQRAWESVIASAYMCVNAWGTHQTTSDRLKNIPRSLRETKKRENKQLTTALDDHSNNKIAIAKQYNERNERADGISNCGRKLKNIHIVVIRERQHIAVDSSTRYSGTTQTQHRPTQPHARPIKRFATIKSTWRCAEALGIRHCIELSAATALRSHYLYQSHQQHLSIISFSPRRPFWILFSFRCFCLKNKSFVCFNYYYYALRAQL